MSYFTVISLHRNYFKLRFHPCRVSGWENVTRQYFGKPALGDTNKLIAGHFLKLTCTVTPPEHESACGRHKQGLSFPNDLHVKRAG